MGGLPYRAATPSPDEGVGGPKEQILSAVWSRDASVPVLFGGYKIDEHTQNGNGMAALLRKVMPTPTVVMRPIPQANPALTTGMYCRQRSPSLRLK